MDASLMVGLGIGTFAGLSYWLYNKKRSFCNVLDQIPYHVIDNDLTLIVGKSDCKCLRYAAISGFVQADDKAFSCSYYDSTTKGVIQNIEVKEHKSEWSSSTKSWDDHVRSVSRRTDSVPFSMTNENRRIPVSVLDPLWAEELELTTIYDKFEPVTTTLAENVLNIAAGDRIKGYQTTEKMLLEGTKLTGIGELRLSGGKLILQQPKNSLRYILSPLTFEAILNRERDRVKNWKWVSLVLAVSSGICICYWLFKVVRKWWRIRQQRKAIEQIRAEAAAGAERGIIRQDGMDQNMLCVICLERPRDIVILNCGHVCACRECSERLENCPICRRNIDRLVPTFVS